jgi:hypothetical protein
MVAVAWAPPVRPIGRAQHLSLGAAYHLCRKKVPTGAVSAQPDHLWSRLEGVDRDSSASNAVCVDLTPRTGPQTNGRAGRAHFGPARPIRRKPLRMQLEKTSPRSEAVTRTSTLESGVGTAHHAGASRAMASAACVPAQACDASWVMARLQITQASRSSGLNGMCHSLSRLDASRPHTVCVVPKVFAWTVGDRPDHFRGTGSEATARNHVGGRAIGYLPAEGQHRSCELRWSSERSDAAGQDFEEACRPRTLGRPTALSHGQNAESVRSVGLLNRDAA